MDQNGQAKSPETAPPAYFTKAMKRYASRVFGAYNPVTGQREQHYGAGNPFKVIRSFSPSDPSQNRKNKRQIIRIGSIFFVRFPKKSISFKEKKISRACEKWKDLGIIQNNNMLNPGFARYVITHPDFFGFHSVGKIIDDYVQEKSPLFNVREPKGENDPGDLADSCFAEIDWLDYGTFIMALNSDEMEFDVNQKWRKIKHEDVVNIFEKYGDVEDVPYLSYKGSIDIPSPKNFKQFIINFIFILIIVKSSDIEDVDQIKIINKSIPGRKETAQILEYFLSLRDGSHIDKSKMETAAFQIASRIASDEISVKYPPKNEKIFGDAENSESAESTEADMLSRISTQLNSLKIDFI